MDLVSDPLVEFIWRLLLLNRGNGGIRREKVTRKEEDTVEEKATCP